MSGATSPSPSDIPSQIGPFKILAQLGEGSFGVVYKAERREPVRQTVALKVLRAGVATKEVLARFELERRALAAMNHRCIAKVLDAGATERGEPWVAMELVEGLPLTTYCDTHKLSLRDRLVLFQQVCDGVQHAHQKGVVHRDLKPGNVFVVREGDSHVPKILDFGLAKATHRDVFGGGSFATQKDMALGTLEYMSPEQARANTEAIDVRSDVYSLGVMLYELLCGELPFPSAMLKQAGEMEARRVVVEEEPKKPSTKLLSRMDSEELAAQRRSSLGALSSALSGDLDWLVMKALRKEPEERYGAALAMAADIGRYLAHEPLEAGPPSWGYRAKKFVRKYRVQCVAGVAVVCAIVAGGSLAWWKSVEAEEQRQKAVQAATEAQRQQKLANESAEVATASELRAKEQQQLAVESAKKEKEARQAAESLAAKDRIYADIARLQDAESRAATLWPAHPSLIADFERWIADVEPILNRLPQIEKDLAEVRLRARSTTVEAIAAARAPIAAEIERLQNETDEAQPRERRAIQKDIAELEIQIEAAGYDFAERADAERHLQLAKLSQLSRSFSKHDKVVAMRGAMMSMRDRLAEAQALAAARPAHQQSWQQAITAIAASDGKTASTLYAHFVLTEQEGLVPIGMDPESKLWEFVHLPSGTKGKEIPRRDPSTGRLVPDGDMGLVFVLLPGGTSWVGTQKEDPAKPNYDPQRSDVETPHQVNLTPYFLSKYEMTQGQWLRLTGKNPSSSSDQNNLALPVEQVSWFECEEWMRLRSLSLPTEAQWEVGCRGGTTTPWWTGSDESDLRAKENVGSFKLAVVGSKSPNPFGLFDTHGNLWEWCLEAFGAGQSPREGDGFRSGGSPSDRSIRGGGFVSDPRGARAGARDDIVASYRFVILGLRPARASRL